MNISKILIKGVLLVALTTICSMFFAMVLVMLGLTNMYTVDLLNPFTYLTMLPGIGLSIMFCFMKQYTLKETYIHGGVWAAMQFAISIAWVIASGSQRPWEQPVVYLYSIGLFIGPLLYYVFRKEEVPKNKKSVMVVLITIILFGVGLPLSLGLYANFYLHPHSLSEVQLSKPDMEQARIIESTEVNGMLVISVQGESLKEDVYTKAVVSVDSNTKVFRITDMGYIDVTWGELLNAEHLTIWFRNGSKVDQETFKGTADIIIIFETK